MGDELPEVARVEGERDEIIVENEAYFGQPLLRGKLRWKCLNYYVKLVNLVKQLKFCQFFFYICYFYIVHVDIKKLEEAPINYYIKQNSLKKQFNFFPFYLFTTKRLIFYYKRTLMGSCLRVSKKSPSPSMRRVKTIDEINYEFVGNFDC